MFCLYTLPLFSQASSSQNSNVEDMLEGYEIKSALPYKIFLTLSNILEKSNILRSDTLYYMKHSVQQSIINHETNKISPNCAFSLFFFRFSKSECSNYQQLYTREASNVSISQNKWTLQLAVCATKTAMINSNFSASSPEVSYKKNSVKLTSFVNYFLFLQSSLLHQSFSLIFIGLI